MAFSTHKKSRLGLFIPILLVVLFFSLIPQKQKRALWYEQMLANIVYPFQCVFTSLSRGTHALWDGYFSLVGTKEENATLHAENARIKTRLVRLEELEKENERLRGLLGYTTDSFGSSSVSARVVANDPRAEFKSLMIDRGSDDGIALYMPVVGPRGLVGRIGRVSKKTSLVLLLNDPNCAVDVMVQRSRARGLLIGAVARTRLKSGHYLTRLEYLRRVSDVRDSDVVVTSGLDQVYPPGLPIGSIHDIERSTSGIFNEAEVIPFENFAELQEVVVLLYKAKG